MDDTPAGGGTPLPRTSAPAERALAAAGFRTLEQVRDSTAAGLLALHGVGPRAVRLLREALAEHGWELPDR